MDKEQLINQIIARVNERLMSSKLLTLTQKHQQSSEENCRVIQTLDQYDGVVLHDFSNATLGKLADGIGDTPYLEIAVKTILSGKKLYVIKEEVELYASKTTAPRIFYNMMEEKIKFLTSAGVIFCSDPLEQPTGNCERRESPKVESPKLESLKVEESSLSSKIEKRVITEKDMVKIQLAGVTQVSILKNAILTDLAKEFAHAKRITITRESS